MKWWQVYLRIALALKTPFVLPLDLKYVITQKDQIKKISVLVKSNYESDLRDCDDFAWRFKAEANWDGANAVGFVIGRALGTLHAWNVAIMDDGVWQIEPQTGEVFRKKKGYIPLVVII